MRLSNIKFPVVLIIVIVLAMTFNLAVYSDVKDGWKGYGLYNINDSKIKILQENTKLELQNGKIKLDGEYVIKNMTDKELRVSLGTPVNGIENISMLEDGNKIKWRKRSFNGLQSEFKVLNRLPQEAYWYVFNITLNPQETRTLSLKFDAIQQLDEEGAYFVSYFGDRKLGFSNQAEKSSLYIKIGSFEPYNILTVKGVNPSDIGKNGEILLEANEENIKEIRIRQKNLTAQAIDRLSKSRNSKLREAVSVFKTENYDKAVYLCDEYMKNPSDEKISNEQILFIKAESLRRQQKYEPYLQLIETIDYNKLYPTELKNKLYFDKANIYLEKNEQDKLNDFLEELYDMPDESTGVLTAWMKNNGFSITSDTNIEKPLEDNNGNKQLQKTPTAIILEYYDKIMDLPYTPVILFLAGVLCGLFLRKTTNRKKRKRYTYKYRR